MQPLVDIFPMVVGGNATTEFDTMKPSKEGRLHDEYSR